MYALGLAAVFMTAFYMFRALFMTFDGDFRGGADSEAQDAGEESEELHLGHVSLHESPWVMVAPLVILAVLAILIGFVSNPLVSLGIVPDHWFIDFMKKGWVSFETHKFSISLALVSTVVAVAGIFVAYMMYYRQVWSAESMGRRFRSAYTTLSRKYYFDELYEDVLVRRVFL